MTAAQKRVLRALIEDLTRFEPELHYDTVGNTVVPVSEMEPAHAGRWLHRESVLDALRSAHSNE